MKETHVHNPKQSLSWHGPARAHCSLSKGWLPQLLFCHSIIMKLICDGQLPAVLASLSESLSIQKVPPCTCTSPTCNCIPLHRDAAKDILDKWRLLHTPGRHVGSSCFPHVQVAASAHSRASQSLMATLDCSRPGRDS